MSDVAQRVGPSRRIRWIGRAINMIATRAPWAWRLIGPLVGRFFDASASGWDERVTPASRAHLGGIEQALALIEAEPRSVLDIGTGTGAAALMLAERYPQADVLGIDISARMIDVARSKADASESRTRFEVADISKLSAPGGFDLITMLNMPPFFEPVARLLRPGGHLIHVSSAGNRTPFYTSERELRSGFERQGLTTATVGEAGGSTYYVASRPA